MINRPGMPDSNNGAVRPGTRSATSTLSILGAQSMPVTQRIPGIPGIPGIPSYWITQQPNPELCPMLEAQIGIPLQIPSTSLKTNISNNDITFNQKICIYPFLPDTTNCPYGTNKVTAKIQVGSIINENSLIDTQNGMLNKDLCLTSKVTSINSRWNE
jgi:hypothetical protein